MLLTFAMLCYAEHVAHIYYVRFMLNMLLIFTMLCCAEHAAHLCYAMLC